MLDTNTFSLPVRHQRRVNILQFDGSGDLLASGGDDGLLNIWSFKLEAYVVLQQFSEGITSMIWLPSGFRYGDPKRYFVVVALVGGHMEELAFSLGDVSVKSPASHDF